MTKNITPLDNQDEELITAVLNGYRYPPHTESELRDMGQSGIVTMLEDEAFFGDDYDKLAEFYRTHGVAYDKDFTRENLLQFEQDFFAVPTEYPHLRYGQAFTNIFGAILPADIFYNENAVECRTIVWQELGEK